MVQRIVMGCCGSVLVALVMASCSSTDSTPVQVPSSGGSGGEGGSIEADAPLTEQPAEAAVDVTKEPEAAAPKCPEGSWGNVPDTKCSLLAQDCPTGQTCTAVYLNNAPSTRCLSSNNGFKTRGEPCADKSECAAGLKCVFGSCAPVCCKEAEFDLCGPGGSCGVNVQVDDKGQYTVKTCTYMKPCTLWAKECPNGQGCHVEGTDGSGSCTLPVGDAFLNPGEKCVYPNDCGDDQICIAVAGVIGKTCRYLCQRGASPMDAGQPDGGPGSGGCPSGETCGVSITDYPDWLGVCAPPTDGG